MNHRQKGKALDKALDSGQRIAVRVARGAEESEFLGVVRSLDQKRGLVSLEMKNQTKGMMPFLPGKSVTIIGATPGSNLDIPCVVDEESRFPILVCRRANRRNHFRVNAFLQLKYRIVERGLYEADPDGLLAMMREEMGGSETSFEVLAEQETEESLDPRLMCLLADIRRKLDWILASLDTNLDGRRQKTMAVNISGSGLRFTVPERIGAEELLAIRITLPLSPPASVVFLGEVTRVRDKGNGQSEIAVRYLAIDEMDRDQIVRYTFKRLRESVRNKPTETEQK